MPKHRQKRKPGEWHHRVPDFKLVYCGRQPTTDDLRKVKLKQSKGTNPLKTTQ